jgi:hypothetical protein
MATNAGMLACAGFLGFFALLFGTLVLTRWFRHKETMAMIERGLEPNNLVRKRNGKGTSTWGIVITAFGLALICGALPLVYERPGHGPDDFFSSMGPVMLPGLIVLFMGVALIIIYFVNRPEPTTAPLEDTLPPVEPGETPDLPAVGLEADEESPEEKDQLDAAT